MYLPTALFLLIPILLVGCGGHSPPGCTGPVRQLNAGKWLPAPNDLSLPPVPGRNG